MKKTVKILEIEINNLVAKEFSEGRLSSETISEYFFLFVGEKNC